MELSFIELVQIYYDEIIGDPDFAQWLSELGYYEGMSDEQLYSILPDEIKESMYGDMVNFSWWHDGM